MSFEPGIVDCGVLAEDSALASLDERTISAMMGVIANNSELLRVHRPGVVCGDLRFFAAVADGVDAAERGQRWAPYVEGRIERYAVDCAHHGFAQPRPLGEVVRVLADLLSR